MLLRLLLSVGSGIVDLVSGLFRKEQDHTYTAEFGNEAEHISRFNYGFAITGAKALTKKVSHNNCALFGPTGSGKSTVCIISSAFSLARAGSSMVFNDVSGEVFEKTSGYLAKKGYRILRLDFSNSANSESFNPLIECRSISDIQKVALLIVRNSSGESKGDVFWEQSSIMLLCLMIRYLVFHAEPQYRTLQNTLRLIETFAVDGPTVDKLFVKTNDEELLAAYKATIVVGDKTLQSIIATTRTALSLFCDPEVCKTTATNSIDFNLLRKEPVALYVCNPLKDLMYFKPLSALFFQSLFNFSLSRLPGKNERSLFIILEEAATMRFPALSLTVSNIRKFSAGILLCMQDEMALISQYGQAEAHQIKTNCGTQIYLKGQPLHTCKELSQILGKRTLLDEKGHERARELLTPDELRICEEAIILIGNYPPLKCKTVPYFENIWMSHHTQLTPFQVTTKNAAKPPLIQFNTA
ncbi:MAG: type IV secretory system conjugative DNA transfer family protein [Patescibacteria group bacterium]